MRTVQYIPVKLNRKMPIDSRGDMLLIGYRKWRKLSGANSVEENKSTSPDELLKVLKRYLQESNETERAIASRIGVNRHTLSRWLSDSQSPKTRADRIFDKGGAQTRMLVPDH